MLHNLRPAHIGERAWQQWWPAHQDLVPPQLRAEIERELQRLELVKQQLRALEVQRERELAHNCHPLVTQLTRLRTIGPKSGWMLAKELFEWRHFDNRRQLAGSLGLTPTRYNSGNSRIDQGISKAGNKRVRALLVELSWRWLRLQPDSQLTHWFNQRFATTGEIPSGATLKPADAV